MQLYSFLQQTLSSGKTSKYVQIPKNVKQESHTTDFVEKVTKAFLSDIALYKLFNSQNLFHDSGHSLPSETTCRKTMLLLSANELQRIKKRCT